MKELPVFGAWAFRDLNRQVGWVFGLILAPFPRDEQGSPGSTIRALLVLEVWVQFRRWPFVQIGRADSCDRGGPRDRPVRIPDAYGVHDRGYNPALGERLRVLLDGKEQFDVVAYDRRAGWLERYKDSRQVISDRLVTERLRGKVEVKWIRDEDMV